MQPSLDPIDAAQRNKRLIDLAVTFGFVGLVLLLVYTVFAPLFPALLWGALLAIICAHPYELLCSRLRGRRGLADLLFGLFLMVVLLLPAVFFAWELILSFPVLVARIGNLSIGPLPGPPAWLADLPGFGTALAQSWSDATSGVSGNLARALPHLDTMANWLLGEIGTFGAFLFNFSLGLVIALFALHYRFQFRAFLSRLLGRVGGAFASRLVVSAFDTTRAAFAGVVVSAILQTLLVAIALLAAGVPAVILFAGLTFFLTVIQIGPLPVLIPAGLILLGDGAYLVAAILAIWFIAVVTPADNLVRPYFSSRASSLPGLFAFLGTVGGFLSWGLIGVFVGPVLTSILYEMLIAWLYPEEGEPQHPAAP